MRPSTLLPTVLWLAAACGGSGSALPPPQSGTFVPYVGAAVALYPDTIDPAAVGLEVLSISPRSDTQLRDRVTNAELVARVRVSTVTSDSAGGGTYHLGVSQLGDSLIRGPAVDPSFELDLASTSASYGLAKAMDARLIGRTFILIWRRFASESGPTAHFLLLRDDHDMATAITDIIATNDLARR